MAEQSDADGMAEALAAADMRRQANRLHHLSMIYVGAIAELAEGKELGLIPSGRPGLSTTRDVLDLMLFVRAEMNALSKLLIEKGVVSRTELLQAFKGEYEHMADVKGQQFGCEVTDAGLVWKKDG